MHKAIFLDRDGTINVDTGYTYKIEDLKFEEGAVEGLKLLQGSGFKLIIVTGQSGIGRGYYTEEYYHRFMQHMRSELRRKGVNIERDYFCPHHPEKGKGKYRVDCECRKPKIRMLKMAASDFGLDLSRCWVVGDKTDDIEMGRRANCRTVLVRTGKGGKDGNFKVTPEYTADNLLDAARYIISNSKDF